jgi:hypothetical protein
LWECNIDSQLCMRMLVIVYENVTSIHNCLCKCYISLVIVHEIVIYILFFSSRTPTAISAGNHCLSRDNHISIISSIKTDDWWIGLSAQLHMALTSIWNCLWECYTSKWLLMIMRLCCINSQLFISVSKWERYINSQLFMIDSVTNVNVTPLSNCFVCESVTYINSFTNMFMRMITSVSVLAVVMILLFLLLFLL